MSDYSKFYSRINAKIEKLFYSTILPPKVIIGLQSENKKVVIIATSALEHFFSGISTEEFKEAMYAVKGTQISDAYFDVSFSVPVEPFLPRAK